MKALVCLCAGAAVLAGIGAAQEQVAPWNMRERLIAVVPMTGSGTTADPRRPLFAPKPGEKSAIEGYRFEPSEDGRFAIVEFVAAHPDAFKPLMADSRVLKAFRKGRHARAQLESELRVYKRDLKLERLLGPGGAW